MKRNNNAKRAAALRKRKACSEGMRAVWARRKAEGYQPSLNGIRAMHAKLAASHGRAEWQHESEEDVEAQLQRIEAAAKRKRWAA